MLRLAALVSLLIGLTAVPPAAAASTHRHRHHAVAALCLTTTQPGASIIYQARAQDLVAIAMAPPVSRAALQLPPSFVAAHSARVQRDMIYFAPEIPPGDLPALPNERTFKPPATSPFVFVQTPPSADLLQVMRDRDRLRLWEPPPPNVGIGLAEGIGMFVTATMMAAHLPRPLRFLVDRRVHLGPSVFSDGGMGAGVGGHWM